MRHMVADLLISHIKSFHFHLQIILCDRNITTSVYSSSKQVNL